MSPSGVKGRPRKVAQDLYVACAGWAVPSSSASRFPTAGSHLERYASRFPAVEINTSFSRSHQPATYARWAATVPEPFRFAVKVPKHITHASRLTDVTALEQFLSEATALGKKLGPLLVQLPPSFAFEARVAGRFFRALRTGYAGAVACEPRHPSWFTAEAEKLLVTWQVARVAADPPPVPSGAEPGGWNGLVYYRLHGSPRTYYSAYADDFLESLTRKLVPAARVSPTWCIFDNTASGAATPNALTVLDRLPSSRPPGQGRGASRPAHS